MRGLWALIGAVPGLIIGLLLLPALEFFGLFLGVFLAIAGGMIGAAPPGRHLSTARWVSLGLLVGAFVLMVGGVIGLALGLVAVVYGGIRGMRESGPGSPPVHA
jgi:hypothetical protein